MKSISYIILIISTRGISLSYVQLATSKQGKWRLVDENLEVGGGGGGNKSLNVAKAGTIMVNINTDSN